MIDNEILSLTDLCLKSVCKDLKYRLECLLQNELGASYSEIEFKKCPKKSYLGFNENVFLHQKLSEKLITTLSINGILNDYTMSLFDCENTRLSFLKIPDASKLSSASLNVLRKHKLKEVQMNNLDVTITDLVKSFGEWTLDNLDVLDISRISCFDFGSYDNTRMYCIFVYLTKIKNLRELDVSHTEFNSHNLEIIAEDLPTLESLNISETRVHDIIPLRKCKHRLKKLIMANVKLSVWQYHLSGETCNEVILNLHELRHLDISYEKNSRPFDIFSSTDDRYTCRIIDFPEKLPNLISLDVSGQRDIEESNLVSFLRSHPNLKFIGLMCSEEASSSSVFLNSENSDFRNDLQVTGTGSLEQIALAMRLYEKRSTFIQLSLYSLYTFSEREILSSRVDMIELVTGHMQRYKDVFIIQLASTACLYNLTRYCSAVDVGPGLPSELMSEIIELTLGAMEAFPSHVQLQKNVLLTLCNDKVLEDKKMNKFRCAKLVLNAFCLFNNETIERLCVAILSVVAAKISSRETSEIGSRSDYMKKLLAIVQRKLDAKSVDTTLVYALSTLWNLTDESPRTCLVFLKEGGLSLFLAMLIEYVDAEPILTKLLGLLNNIAEVPEIKYLLMDERMINSIRGLLRSNYIEVSYFSAGILVHLVSSKLTVWTVINVEVNTVLQELSNAIANWNQPDEEMVAYRSFKPFLPLLQCSDMYPVQLWALWAIQHVLTSNGKKYSEMLEEEGVCDILRDLTRYHFIDRVVQASARIILNQLNDFATQKILAFKFG